VAQVQSRDPRLVNNPLSAVARHPIVYRWMLRFPRLIEWSDRFLRMLSRNRLGAMDVVGVASLHITVAGRRTGIPRTTTLSCIAYRAGFLVVGSNWGRPQHPGWSANLLAATEVTIEHDGTASPATARLVTGADRDHAWSAILREWPNYRIAQEIAYPRLFRIFELTPIASAAS
jgi:deazaflavin-dependent oxidoreductase (nitroreductase family)